MSEHSDYLGEGGIIEWEREVRGYNRQQVDEVVARQTGTIRDLKNSLTQCLAEIERLRDELTEARAAGRRPHEEVSERVGQILKLAEDEAKVMRERGSDDAAAMREAAKAETEKLSADTKQETDRLRAEAQDRAERMLAAAAEQSERTVTSAKAEANELISSAQAAAEQTVAQATSHAESTVAAAMSQAKQQLDDATARANAIHDGSERRLNLLISRHTETVRRLTEIRDVVTSLVSGEATRGSLEDEVNRALSPQSAGGADGRSAVQHQQAAGGAHRARAEQPAPGSRQAAHAPGHGQPAPGQAAPGHAAPGEPAPGEPAPGEPAPGMPMHSQTVHSQTVHSQAAHAEATHAQATGHVPLAVAVQAAQEATTRLDREQDDPLTAELSGTARHKADPVDTRKRPSRMLDEAGAGGHGRSIEN